VKTDREKAGYILYNCAEALRIAAVLLHPVMPERTAKLLACIGEPVGNFVLSDAVKWGRLRSGTQMQTGDPLFPRIDEKDLPVLFPDYFDAPVKSGTADAAPMNLIEISDFTRVELRTAKVLQAEVVDGTDKLLKLQIDVGGLQRQIIAGIAQHYRPDDLIGKSIIIVANLKPAKLRGETSEGMLLAAKSDGKLSLLTVDDHVPSGSTIG
jgi:methionyl-tRNA synthetase